MGLWDAQVDPIAIGGTTDTTTPERHGTAGIQYDAFLSYSHADGQAATAIQRGLHRVGRRMGRLRALRVFRDQTELTANPDLWGRVADAMDASRYFVLLASPRAAKSEWVNRELDFWIARRGTGELLLAVLEGELVWDASAGRLDPTRSTAAPDVLTRGDTVNREPLFVDFSGQSIWDVSDRVFRERVVTLAAPIHGKPREELSSDDRREQRRFRRWRDGVIAGLAVLLVASIAAAAIALIQRAEAQHQRAEAQHQTAEALALALTAQSELLAEQNPALSMALAAEAVVATNPPRREAQRALLNSRTAFADRTVQPIGDPLIGHTGFVQGVAFSPDGTVLASAGDDRTVRLWNPTTGDPIGKALEGHKGTVWNVAFSPDGTLLASASDDGTVRLWNPTTGKLRKSLDGHDGPLRGVAFSPDGALIASGGSDGTVRLWNPTTGNPIGKLEGGQTGPVFGLAFNRDGTVLASGSSTGTVRMWNPATGNPIGSPFDSDPLDDFLGVHDVAFSPDGTLLATASDDWSVQLWNPTTGDPVGQPLEGHTRPVMDVEFSADGTVLASGSSDGTVRFWNPTTGEPIGKPGVLETTGFLNGLAFSPDGTVFATGNSSGTVRLWNAAFPDPIANPLVGDTGPVWGVAFSPDGNLLASATDDGTVLWNLNIGDPGPKRVVLDTGAVWAVAFSPDGTVLATAGEDGTIRLWNPTTGDPIGSPLEGHTARVTGLAFSPDGTVLASGSSDGTVRSWDATTGDPIGDALDTRVPGQGGVGQVTGVAFSPDGTVLASPKDNGTVQLWDPTTGVPIGNPLEGHSGKTHVAFSPDGTLLATAGWDGAVQLRDATTGNPIGNPLIGHTGPVLGLAFSPDGTVLASAGEDGTVRLWNPTTGNAVGDPLVQPSFVTGVAFSPDGTLLASPSSETISLWDAIWNPDRACERLRAFGALRSSATCPKGSTSGHALISTQRVQRGVADHWSESALACISGHCQWLSYGVIVDLERGAMLDARFLGPAPSRHLLTQPSLQAVQCSRLTVVSGAPAHLVDENLAKVLDDDGRLKHAAWLRLSRLDAQPAHLVESAGRSTSRVERRLGGVPEPLVALSPCGARTVGAAGAQLADRLPTDATLVIDNTLGPMDATTVLELVEGWLSPTADRRVVLLWPQRPPRRVRRAADAVLGPHELLMGHTMAQRIATESGLTLSARSIESLLWSTRGRAPLLHPLLTEIGARHPDLPLDVASRCHRRSALPDWVVRNLLGRCGLSEREILSATLDLGFWHPSMTSSATADHDALEGVWLSRLEEGWFRLPPAWAPPLQRQLHATPFAPGREDGTQPCIDAAPVAPVEAGEWPEWPAAPAPSNSRRADTVDDIGADTPTAHRLEAKLLGGFEFTVDGRAVSFQNGPRGLMLLKYLLAHHPRPQQRDVLMDVFWPGVDPDRARSRLHVALSGLRRSFKGLIDVPVVEFRAGRYQLSSELELRTDVEDFERLAAMASEAEHAGDSATAIECCERAIAVYRGDFLVDEPYEDWALLRRETLRVKYLDLLDRLTTSYLADERIGECISAAQHILHQDACREDAHRLLMRCYARQGRIHQVTRQFELCARAIQSALGCEPSEATATLYRSIRLDHVH